jgi:hypothetical protein
MFDGYTHQRAAMDALVEGVTDERPTVDDIIVGTVGSRLKF